MWYVTQINYLLELLKIHCSELTGSTHPSLPSFTTFPPKNNLAKSILPMIFRQITCKMNILCIIGKQVLNATILTLDYQSDFLFKWSHNGQETLWFFCSNGIHNSVGREIGQSKCISPRNGLVLWRLTRPQNKFQFPSTVRHEPDSMSRMRLGIIHKWKFNWEHLLSNTHCISLSERK